MNKFISIIFSFFFIIYFLSCSSNTSSETEPNKDNNKITITIDGGGYTNDEYELSVTNSFINSGAFFYADSNFTECRIYGTSGSIPHSVDLFFSGDSIGLYDIQPIFPSYNYIIMQLSSNPIIMLNPISGQIQITNYGEIGQRIEGNFTGDFIKRSSFDTLNVVGTFSFIRNDDK